MREIPFTFGPRRAGHQQSQSPGRLGIFRACCIDSGANVSPTAARTLDYTSEGMFRTRFKKEIVAEFLPPAQLGKKEKAIILCDGMPSIPRKQSLAEFLSKKATGFFTRAIAGPGKVMANSCGNHRTSTSSM